MREWVDMFLLPALVAAFASPTDASSVVLSPRALADTPDQNCTNGQLVLFIQPMLAEYNACVRLTSYDWISFAFPTYSQQLLMCTCTPLIAKLQQATLPQCRMVKDNELYTLEVIQYNYFSECDFTISPTSTPTTSAPVPETATPSTTAPPTRPTVTPLSTAKPPSLATPAPTASLTSSTTDSQAPLINGLVGGLAICAIINVFLVYRRKQASKQAEETTGYEYQHHSQQPGPSPSMHYAAVARTPEGGAKATPVTTAESSGNNNNNNNSGETNKSNRLWDDPMITAMRIPLDTVFFGPLLSRGGFGEVYKGTYMGETVAIKQLLPARRKDLAQIDSFLAEVKLLASFDHERIVAFCGVAWNSLSDVCVVLEYMANGDLRSVLSKWQYGEDQRPQGFDADKVKIALHVAHAVTYLHSLQPVVVHRDLKSKNILLSDTYDAKLADFGISREQQESTMTAGVGTSLWMAPEVMLGERYNEKADVFSFGVVLCELDTHQLPYAHVMDDGEPGGRKIPDSAILQMVSLGRLTIQFSGNAHPDLVQLGRECVLMDPTKRPTSGQVLHRVHQVYRQF